MAKNLDGIAMMASFNCDDDYNKPLCVEYGVKGFPTVTVLRPSMNKKGMRIQKTSGKLARCYKRFSYPLCLEYLGPRDAKHLKDYLLSLLPSNVQRIKGISSKAKSKGTVSLDAFLEKGVRYRGKVEMDELLY